MSISIQHADFDLAAELAALRAAHPQAGAVVSFVGLVRDFNTAGEVSGIHLEHYPGMCETVLAGILAEAAARWRTLGARVIHRIGPLGPQEQIVLVATAAHHRGDAFAACEFIIDALKTAAPFWKKELTGAGDHWLETRASDIERMTRWQAPHGEPT